MRQDIMKGFGFTMTDYIRACLLCGSTMNDLTPAQVKMFGKPKCCEDVEMVLLPTKNLHTVIKALAQLKINLEKELVEGFNCGQYLEVEK
jgi:hypothetical protein